MRKTYRMINMYILSILAIVLILHSGCGIAELVAKFIWHCVIVGNNYECACEIIGLDTYADNNGQQLPCDPDNPNGGYDTPIVPDGFAIENDCDYTYLKLWVGGQTDRNAIVWASIERKSDILSYSQPIQIESGTYAGYILRIPLDGIFFDSDEYEISVYSSEAVENVGSPASSFHRSISLARLTIPQEVAQAVAQKPKIQSYIKTLYDDYSCMLVGQSLRLKLNYFMGDMHIVEGYQYLLDNIEFEVGGNVLNAGTVSDQGVFMALKAAPYHGDCFVIARDIGLGLADTMGIIIDESCDDAIIVDTAGTYIAQNQCVYIDEIPTMPQLNARITGFGSITGLIDWAMRVSYKRSGRDDETVFTETLDASQTWNLYNAFGGQFFGGEAIIMAEPRDIDCMMSFSFSIRGLNADTNTIIDYVLDNPDNIWYCRWVARWEGGEQEGRRYLQFNEDGDLNCNGYDIKYTPNANNNGDGGMGIYQLTNFSYPERLPNVEEMWNWQVNADMGVWWLSIRQGEANIWMTDQRTQAEVEMGGPYPVPNHTVANVVFSDGTNIIIEHAVALKWFNGASGGHYCYWNNEFDRWDFNELNLDGRNYVNEICQQVP